MKNKLIEVRKHLQGLIGNSADKVSGIPASKVAVWLLFILLTFVTTMLISYRVAKLPAVYKVGKIAPYDIKADNDYTIVDKEATAKHKADALQNIKVIYIFDPFLGTGIAERVKAAFVEVRRIFQEDIANLPVNKKKYTYSDLSETQLLELRDAWDNIVGSNLTDKEWKLLIDTNFSQSVESKINSVIEEGMTYPIVANNDILEKEREKGIVVRKLPAAGQDDNLDEEEWNDAQIDEALTVEDIQAGVIKGKYIPETVNIDDYESRIAIKIASDLVRANMNFDAQSTESRRQSTLKDIKNVVINIQRGESIIRGGSRYEPWHITVLDGVRSEKSERSLPLEMVGSFLLIFIIYYIVYKFGRKYVRKFAPTKTNLIFMGTLMIIMLIILRVSMFLASAIHGMSIADIPKMALTYAIPLAAGTMLVRFIINSETAALFAVVLAAFAGIVVQGNIYFTSFTLMSSLVAAVAISHSDKRSSILNAGLITGFISALMVLSIHFINAASVVEPLSLNNTLWYVIAAVVNGVGCAVFVLVMVPLSESIFGYTTDIKLLELANLNHPLLRELIIRAPGTYHHSHLVGILAETAAEAVGANPLLARVGAYYHDIGKIKKPQYFTENMPEGASIHDKLTPHMSSLIVSSHVKDGLELAKLYKLPEVITEMIPQHHGTKKISFFYEKAKEATDPNLQKIEDKDFRYPGPTPQSREAAILMIADGSEAAVRSLKDKTPAKIQQIVENIIDKNFTEGQFNECELTLKDLNKIAQAFTRILISIYHQRIEYPKETLEKNEDEISVFVEGDGAADSDNQ